MPLDPFSLQLFSGRAGTTVHLSARSFSSHQLEPKEGCFCTLLVGEEELHFSPGLLVAASSMKSRGLGSNSPAPPWHGLLGQATVGYPTSRILTLPVHKPLLAEVCVACLWQCWHPV